MALSTYQEKFIDEHQDLINSGNFKELVEVLYSCNYIYAPESIALLFLFNWVINGVNGFSLHLSSNLPGIPIGLVVYSNKTRLTGFRGKPVLPSMLGRGKIDCYKISNGKIDSLEELSMPNTSSDFSALATQYSIITPSSPNNRGYMKQVFGEELNYTLTLQINQKLNLDIGGRIISETGLYQSPTEAIQGLSTMMVTSLTAKYGESFRKTITEAVTAVSKQGVTRK
jgi:hypothetical protein